MRKLCCTCRSSSIAALIYTIIVPDMHGQKGDTENYQIAAARIAHLRDSRAAALQGRVAARPLIDGEAKTVCKLGGTAPCDRKTHRFAGSACAKLQEWPNGSMIRP